MACLLAPFGVDIPEEPQIMSKLVFDFIFDSSCSISSWPLRKSSYHRILTTGIFVHGAFIVDVYQLHVTWDYSESFHQDDPRRDVQNPFIVQGRREQGQLRKGVCSCQLRNAIEDPLSADSFCEVSASTTACSSFLIRKKRRTVRCVINHTRNILHLYKHSQCTRFNSQHQPKPKPNQNP